MTLLQDLNKLHDKWDAKGGQSGSDSYEDALYSCINDLADLILKHTNEDRLRWCTCNTKQYYESTAGCPVHGVKF